MSSHITSPHGEKVESHEVDLLRLLSELIEHRLLIISTTVLFSIFALAWVFCSTPIYVTDAMIQIEQKQENSLLRGLSSLTPLENMSTDSASEIQLLKSRMILGKTVNNLNLHYIVVQKYFPLIGRGWAKLTQQKPATLTVEDLIIPVSQGKNPGFILTVGQSGQFSIEGENISAQGRVGEHLEKSGFSVRVTRLDAQPGTRFLLKKVTELEAINAINLQLDVTEKSKDSGILRLTFTGSDPQRNTAILNSITANYLEQNIKRKAAQDSQSLIFLRHRLPLVRADLDQAEERLNTYRKMRDSVDLNLEAKTVLEQVVNIQNQLNTLTFREAEIAQLYKKDHPTYRALADKRVKLEQEKTRLNSQIAAMPTTQQEIIRLSRDVDSGRAIYLQLLTRQQELGISESSVTGNVRIIDDAVTQPDPVSPRKALIVIAMTFLGLLSSSMIVCLRFLFHRVIDSSEQLEELGFNVYATLPRSSWLVKEILRGKKRRFALPVEAQAVPFLPTARPMDLFVESVRGLRTSLHFAMMDADNNILMLSGPTEGCGKTLVSTTLATIVAQVKPKVLFIDADMRMGYTHQLFNLNNDNGLSAVLSGKITCQEGIQHFPEGGFDVLTCGQTPPNPSELLMQERFKQLMQWANDHYDLVIVDTPPVLAVTDASVVGRYCATTLLVVRFGMTSPRELSLCTRRLQQSGVSIRGVILNDVTKRGIDINGTAQNYYGHYYQSDKSQARGETKRKAGER